LKGLVSVYFRCLWVSLEHTFTCPSTTNEAEQHSSAAESSAVILGILQAADTYSGPFSEVPPVATTSALAGCDNVRGTSGLLAAGSCRTVHGELSADELHVLKSISVSKNTPTSY